jgi:PAS domain S-box-containing protein
VRSGDVFTPDAAFDVAPDWIALVDTGHVIRRVNQTMADALGVSPDELVGRRCHDVMHGTDAPLKACPHARVLAEPDEVRRDIVEVPGRGVFEVLCAPLRDAGGALAGTVHMMHDISRRVHVELQAQETRETLRAREALLRGLFDTMPSGCVVYEVRGEGRDPDDFIVRDINRTALTMDGLRRDDVVERRVNEVWPQMAENASLQALWRVWRTGDPESRSTRIHARDGAERWYDDHLFKLPTGDVVEIYSDVTAARRAEEELRSREAEMHAVFDLAGIPMVVMDTRGGFRRWNRAFAKALGYPPEDLREMTVRDITVPEERADMLRRLAGAMDGAGAPYRIERRIVTVDGTHLWFDVSVTPVVGPEGSVVALIAAGVDVGARRRSQEELLASQAQLREALGGTVASMGAIVAIRDPYTAGHEQRVADLAVAIARDLGLPEQAVTGLRHAASMHDVGKVAVPAEILTMPRRLSEWEYSLVQTHVEVGHEVLAGISFEQPVAATVLQHHERLDGSGYPHGLRGDEILLTARILAVADVVEAMASSRPYRPALGVGAAMDEIGRGAGRLYDERVVAACQRVVRHGLVDLSEATV